MIEIKRLNSRQIAQYDWIYEFINKFIQLTKYYYIASNVSTYLNRKYNIKIMFIVVRQIVKDNMK